MATQDSESVVGFGLSAFRSFPQGAESRQDGLSATQPNFRGKPMFRPLKNPVFMRFPLSAAFRPPIRGVSHLRKAGGHPPLGAKVRAGNGVFKQETDMKMTEAQFAWNPIEQGGDIEVGPYPDLSGWTKRYANSKRVGHEDPTGVPPVAQVSMLFIDFNHLVVSQRLDPKKVHAEFKKIDDYRAFDIWEDDRDSPMTLGAVQRLIDQVRAEHAERERGK
jgi:hypothetical protein